LAFEPGRGRDSDVAVVPRLGQDAGRAADGDRLAAFAASVVVTGALDELSRVAVLVNDAGSCLVECARVCSDRAELTEVWRPDGKDGLLESLTTGPQSRRTTESRLRRQKSGLLRA